MNLRLWWLKLSAVWKEIFIENLALKDFFSLNDIEYVFTLTELDCSGKEIQDLDPLYYLPQIEVLNLNRTRVRDFNPLRALSNLRELQAVFCEGGRIHGETHAMELESSSHQSPEGLYWPRVGLQSSEGPEHTKAVMCRTKSHKYVRRLYEKDELYDLVNDPQERYNQIDNPDYAEVLAQLKDRLLAFYLETSDVVRHQTDQR